VLFGLAERLARGLPVALGCARLVGTGAGGVLESGVQECCGCPAQDGEGLVVVQAADVLHGDDACSCARAVVSVLLAGPMIGALS